MSARSDLNQPSRATPPPHAVTRASRRLALRGFDAVGAALLRHRPTLPPAEAVGSILLIRWERFGDLVTLLPARQRLRELFPAARVTWMVRPEYHDFFALARLADAAWLVRGWREALRAPRRRFDLALDFHADVRALLVGRRHARYLAGYGIRGGAFLLDRDGPYPWQASAAERHVRLVELAAGATSGRISPPRLDPPSCAPPAGLRPGTYLVLHPGCGQPSKRWPLASWRTLARRCGELGWPIVLAGGAQDQDLCAALRGSCGARSQDYSGRLSWRELAVLIAHAAAVVAPDTGVIHLAQALGTPSLALFGPTDPAIWGYSAPATLQLAAGMGCAPCDRATCRLVRPGAISPCMAAITPQRATAALAALPQPRRLHPTQPAPAQRGRGA